jgi:hypothetical protein
MGISSPSDIADRHLGQSTPAHFLWHKPAAAIHRRKMRFQEEDKRMIFQNSEMKTDMHQHSETKIRLLNLLL